MEYLTGKCKIDFDKWAIDNFGYSSTYYLGFPTIINFFNNTMDIDFPRVLVIGELRERQIIELNRKAIIQANELYNKTFID